MAIWFDVHPTIIAQWKRLSIEGLAQVFSDGSAKWEEASESQIKELHTKIGELTVERDFLSKAFGR